MLLRYTGPVPVTFVGLGVTVEPGDTFEAPDEQAAAFTARADVEQAPAEPKARSRRAKADDPPAPDPAGDPATPAGPVPDTTATL